MDRSEFGDLPMCYRRLYEADRALDSICTEYEVARHRLIGQRFAQPGWMTNLGRQVTGTVDMDQLIKAGEQIRDRMQELRARLETAATQGKERE